MGDAADDLRESQEQFTLDHQQGIVDCDDIRCKWCFTKIDRAIDDFSDLDRIILMERAKEHDERDAFQCAARGCDGCPVCEKANLAVIVDGESIPVAPNSLEFEIGEEAFPADVTLKVTDESGDEWEIQAQGTARRTV